MELQRALSDLAEVRARLAALQRFEGYSGPAAAISGVVALIAGAVQRALAPMPATAPELRCYLTIWLSCLGIALALNYGAVAVWLFDHRAPGARSRFRTAALSIAPSVVLGGALTAALAAHALDGLLPGTWFAFYAIGLLASRGALPFESLWIALGFGLLAIAFLVTPVAGVALAWWVMPLGFGIGQIGIGCLIWERSTA